ncbi:hypothetical protein CLH62_20770 [Marinobacter guineae]|uniref:Uncharacterized protein n=1 Tax=Marinobacter guineae TaxID=432303 RepID=A0A2G1V9U4_9GAMM|nr:hypothetical protein [Marinobacter guineae]PHQ23557.1 hypothetical protein CLH62_20770 [Marinobacter guineae]
MNKAQGFVGLSTGGEGVLYVRISDITAVQELKSSEESSKFKSRVFVRGQVQPFKIQEDPATIGDLIGSDE